MVSLPYLFSYRQRLQEVNMARAAADCSMRLSLSVQSALSQCQEHVMQIPCLTSGAAQQPAGSRPKTGGRRSSPPSRGLRWDGGIVPRVEVLPP